MTRAQLLRFYSFHETFALNSYFEENIYGKWLIYFKYYLTADLSYINITLIDIVLIAPVIMMHYILH